MALQTHPHNVFKIVLPHHTNQTVQFTVQPTLPGPVVRFLDSTLIDADSEYMSDNRSFLWSPHLQQDVAPPQSN